MNIPWQVVWQQVKTEYETTNSNLVDLAIKYKIEQKNINRKARSEGWIKKTIDTQAEFIDHKEPDGYDDKYWINLLKFQKQFIAISIRSFQIFCKKKGLNVSDNPEAKAMNPSEIKAYADAFKTTLENMVTIEERIENKTKLQLDDVIIIDQQDNYLNELETIQRHRKRISL